MTLHNLKRIRQNGSRCDSPTCPGQGTTFITIASGERGGKGDYEARYACSWTCAYDVVTEAQNQEQ